MKKKILMVITAAILALGLLTACGDSDLNQKLTIGNLVLNIPSDYYLESSDDNTWLYTTTENAITIGVSKGSADTTGEAEREAEFKLMGSTCTNELLDESTTEKNGITYYTYSYETVESESNTDAYCKRVCVVSGDIHMDVCVTADIGVADTVDSLFDKIYKTIKIRED